MKFLLCKQSINTNDKISQCQTDIDVIHDKIYVLVDRR